MTAFFFLYLTCQKGPLKHYSSTYLPGLFLWLLFVPTSLVYLHRFPCFCKPSSPLRAVWQFFWQLCWPKTVSAPSHLLLSVRYACSFAGTVVLFSSVVDQIRNLIWLKSSMGEGEEAPSSTSLFLQCIVYQPALLLVQLRGLGLKQRHVMGDWGDGRPMRAAMAYAGLCSTVASCWAMTWLWC